MAQDVYIAPPPPRQPRNWSCCLWGCLVAFIFVVLLTIALALIARSTLMSFRDNWTSTQPQELPAVAIEPAALDALVQRVDAFAASVEQRSPAAPLVLSQDEINALIQHHPDWRDLHDKVYVEIDDGMIKGLVNFPLDLIPLLGGRYLHGAVTFDVEFADGRLQVYVDSAIVNDQPLPEEYMAAIRRENLAQEFLRDNPDAQAVIDQIETIRIEDEKLIIVPKVQAAPPSAGELGDGTDVGDELPALPLDEEVVDAPAGDVVAAP